MKKSTVKKAVRVAMVVALLCTLLGVTLTSKRYKRYVKSVESGTEYIIDYKNDISGISKLSYTEKGFVKIPEELTNYNEEEGVEMTDGNKYKLGFDVCVTSSKLFILKENNLIFYDYQHESQKEP